MPVRSMPSSDGNTLVIKVDGRFDASELDEFRHSYESVDNDNFDTYRVDLRDTEYLDSSALGMLLILRDYAGGEDANILIANCSEEVKRIFTISSFEKLFTIQ